MIQDPLLDTRGNVDSLTLERAEFQRRRLLWKEGPRTFLARYSWNNDGQLTSMEDGDGAMLYAYDSRGREAARYRMDKDGRLRSRELREWDDRNRLLKRVFRSVESDTETLWTCEYDETGRVAAEKTEGSVRVKKTDSRGRLVEDYLYTGETPDLLTEYLWTEQGLLVSETVKDPDGRIHRITRNEYDEEDRLLSTTVEDSDGRLIRDESYAYGAMIGSRWLERVTWIPDGRRGGKRRPSEVVYRSFTLDEDRARAFSEEPRKMAFANGIYTGCLINGSPEGDGIFRYNDESLYEGQFSNGVMSGRGKLSWPDGREMEGEFVDGLLQGKGICRWADGSFYSGEFLNGRMHGAGVFTWADGTRFQGLFEKGQRTSQGAWEKT